MLTRAKARARTANLPTVTDMLVAPDHPQQPAPSCASTALQIDLTATTIAKRVRERKRGPEVLDCQVIERLPACGTREPTTLSRMLADEVDLDGERCVSQRQCEIESADITSETCVSSMTNGEAEYEVDLDSQCQDSQCQSEFGSADSKRTTTLSSMANGIAEDVETQSQSQEEVGNLCAVIDPAEKSMDVDSHQQSECEGDQLSSKEVTPCHSDLQDSSQPTPAIAEQDNVDTHITPHFRDLPSVKNSPIDEMIRQSEKKIADVNTGNMKPVSDLCTPARLMKPDLPMPSVSLLTKDYTNIVKRVSIFAEDSPNIEPEEPVTWTSTPAIVSQKHHPAPVSTSATSTSTRHVHQLSPPYSHLTPNSLFVEKKHERRSRNLLSLEPTRYSQLYSPIGCANRSLSETTVKEQSERPIAVPPTGTTDTTGPPSNTNEMPTTLTDQQVQLADTSEITLTEMETGNEGVIHETQANVTSKILKAVSPKLNNDCDSVPVVKICFDGSEFDSDDESDDDNDKTLIPEVLSNGPRNVKEATDEASDAISEVGSEFSESLFNTTFIVYGSDSDSGFSRSETDSANDICTEASTVNTGYSVFTSAATPTNEHPHSQASLESENYLKDYPIDLQPKFKKRSCDPMDKYVTTTSKRCCTDGIKVCHIQQSNSSLNSVEKPSVDMNESQNAGNSDLRNDLLSCHSPKLHNIQSIRKVADLLSGDTAATPAQVGRDVTSAHIPDAVRVATTVVGGSTGAHGETTKEAWETPISDCMYWTSYTKPLPGAFPILAAMRNIRPYMISGDISAPYLRSLMTTTALGSKSPYYYFLDQRDVNKCCKDSPATLARDMVFRIFTFEELNPVDLRRISRQKLSEIRRCLQMEFPKDYNDGVWRQKCIPLIKSSLTKLVTGRLKQVENFWMLNSC